ncbi:MAG: helix-turn-helix domain-containing protein [Chloroflexota bacterium]
MGNKTYNQYCAVAQALDLVGERWTLLVIRNLLSGPKRFSDLMKGLPGISSNVLTDRLKGLQAGDVITDQYLPPPAASTVYVLTASGMELAAALGALAKWGAPRLGAPQADQHIVPESVVFMILGVFWRPGASADIVVDGNIAVVDDPFEGTFGFTLGGDGFVLHETPNAAASITLTVALEPLLRLSSGILRLDDALASDLVAVTGDTAQLEVLRDWVSSPG